MRYSRMCPVYNIYGINLKAADNKRFRTVNVTRTTI